MPDRSGVVERRQVSAGGGPRRSFARLVAFALILGCAVLVAPTAGAAAETPGLGSAALSAHPTVALSVHRDPVGNVDVDAVVADLDTDHLAGVAPASPDYAPLIAQIERANSSSIDLNVVVLGQEITGAEPDDVAAAILASVGGTVLVLTPNPQNMLTRSQTISQTDLDDAVNAARSTGSDVAAVRAFVDALTVTGFPWSLVVILGVIVLLIVVVAAVLWRRRRGHREEEAGLDRKTAEIGSLVTDLEVDLNYIRERVDRLPDAATVTDFEHLRAEHRQIREQLADHPLRSTEEVDLMDIRVATLRSGLHRIRAAVDAPDAD